MKIKKLIVKYALPLMIAIPVIVSAAGYFLVKAICELINASGAGNSAVALASGAFIGAAAFVITACWELRNT